MDRARSGYTQGRQSFDNGVTHIMTRVRELFDEGDEPQEEPSPEREGQQTLNEVTGYSTPRRRGPTTSPPVSRLREAREEARSSRSSGWVPGEAAGSAAPAAAASAAAGPAAAMPGFPFQSPEAAHIPPPTPSTAGGDGPETPRGRAWRTRRHNGHKIVTDRHHELFHLTAACERYPYGLHAAVMPPTYKLPCGACNPQEEIHLNRVYMSMHGEKYHVDQDCWGLRNRSSSIQMKRACRVCAAGVIDEHPEG